MARKSLTITGRAISAIAPYFACFRESGTRARRTTPSRPRVVLAEAGARILSTFPEKHSDAAEDSLKSLGVEVLKNRRVALHRTGTVAESACSLFRVQPCAQPRLQRADGRDLLDIDRLRDDNRVTRRVCRPSAYRTRPQRAIFCGVSGSRILRNCRRSSTRRRKVWAQQPKHFSRRSETTGECKPGIDIS